MNSRLEDLEAAAQVLRGRRSLTACDSTWLRRASRFKRRRNNAEIGRRCDAGAQPLPSGCGPCIGLGAGLLEPGEVGISATNRNFKGRMGSRDAQCYLASPAVVAASAIAGYICGVAEITSTKITPKFEEFGPAAAAPEKWR